MDLSRLSANDYHGVEKLINDSMAELGRQCNDFGMTVKGRRETNSKFLEKAFQEELRKVLALKTSVSGLGGWSWYREEKVDTAILTNKSHLKADLVGVDRDGLAVVIELKYVTMSIDGFRFVAPSDPYAFPYDVLKDAVKIESLLRRDLPKWEGVRPVFGASIGLTNFMEYWGIGKKDRSAWAQHYWRAVASGSERGAISGIIRTDAKDNSRSIFRNKRCHISFGLPWKISWHDYSSLQRSIHRDAENFEEASQFRYVFLRPESTGYGSEGWDYRYSHDQYSPEFIPFLTKEARDAFFDMRAKYYS